MTLQEIRDKTRFITRTDTTTFSNDDIDREINSAYKQVAISILRAQGYRNQFGKNSYTDLIASDGLSPGDNGYRGQYSFPTDLLKPHRVEVKFSSTGTPVVATVYDMSESTLFSESDDDSLSSMASEENPVVRFENDSYFIRPLNTSGENVSDGIRIWYEYRQSALSEASDVPNFEETFHDILCYMAAIEFYVRYPDKYNRKAEQRVSELKNDLARFYRARMNYRKRITAQVENFS